MFGLNADVSVDRIPQAVLVWFERRRECFPRQYLFGLNADVSVDRIPQAVLVWFERRREC